MSSRRAVTAPDRSGRASGIVVEACLQTVSKTEAYLRVVPRTGEDASNPRMPAQRPRKVFGSELDVNHAPVRWHHRGG